VPEAKITRLNEKIATMREEIQRLNGLNTLMMQAEDKQISLTDPDALDGHERPRQRNGRLQCAKCGRYEASSHCCP
jgi:TolA-binding protein